MLSVAVHGMPIRTPAVPITGERDVARKGVIIPSDSVWSLNRSKESFKVARELLTGLFCHKRIALMNIRSRFLSLWEI